MLSNQRHWMSRPTQCSHQPARTLQRSPRFGASHVYFRETHVYVLPRELCRSCKQRDSPRNAGPKYSPFGPVDKSGRFNSIDFSEEEIQQWSAKQNKLSFFCWGIFISQEQLHLRPWAVLGIYHAPSIMALPVSTHTSVSTLTPSPIPYKHRRFRQW